MKLKTPRKRRIPRTSYPRSLEAPLYRLIWSLFRPWWHQLVSDAQNGVHLDSFLGDLFERARQRWGQLVDSLRSRLSETGYQVDLQSRLSLTRQFAAAGNSRLINMTPANLRNIEDFVAEMTSLVRDLGDQAATRLQRLILDGHKQGQSSAILAASIRRELGIRQGRAQLIAVDQIGKLNGHLTQLNQTQNGITGYFWSGVMDHRERELHVSREGKHFHWDTPPSDGHPGIPVRCRCTAIPDL